MWDYVCPKCKTHVDKKSTTCHNCGEHYTKPLQLPPTILKDKKRLEKYVHKYIFPKISKQQRAYLAQWFTEWLNDNFETGDVSKWTSSTEAGTGDLDVNGGAAHNGSFGLSCYILNKDTDSAYVTLTPIAQPEVYVRTYFRAEETLGGWSWHWLFRLRESGGNDLAEAIWNNPASSDHKWTLRYRKAGADVTIDSYTNVPTADTWFCVELHLLCSTADGNLDADVELWVNEDLVASDYNYDSDYTEVYTLNLGAMIYATWGENYYYYDDVIVADTRIYCISTGCPIPVAMHHLSHHIFSSDADGMIP